MQDIDGKRAINLLPPRRHILKVEAWRLNLLLNFYMVIYIKSSMCGCLSWFGMTLHCAFSGVSTCGSSAQRPKHICSSMWGMECQLLGWQLRLLCVCNCMQLWSNGEGPAQSWYMPLLPGFVRWIYLREKTNIVWVEFLSTWYRTSNFPCTSSSGDHACSCQIPAAYRTANLIS